GVAGQRAPEADPVGDLQPDLVPVPAVVAAQDAADLGVVQVGRVPGAPLRAGRAQTQLEHGARAAGQVGLAAVPDAVVADQQRAGRADHGGLAGEVLVAGDGGLVDAAEVAAGQHHGPAHV